MYLYALFSLLTMFGPTTNFEDEIFLTFIWFQNAEIHISFGLLKQQICCMIFPKAFS